MIWRVLVIGGYGNFGSFITRTLAKEPNIKVIVAGRSVEKGKQLIFDLDVVNQAESFAFDINKDFTKALKAIEPDIVVHTSGPFQKQGYEVAQACIEQGVHYLDLADGREFVGGITELDEKAKEKRVLVVSGASSVPCLTSALIDYYLPEFKSLEVLDYGITTAAILGYIGRPFKTLTKGTLNNIYGWQGLHARKYAGLGWRLLGYCDVPDLALFPERYPTLKTIRFYAGLEVWFIHIALWVLSWLVRIGLIPRLEKMAPFLLRFSFFFDWLGSSKSAFHMVLSGRGKMEEEKSIIFELTAKSGDGPYIPCMPAILMVKRIVNGDIGKCGAYPCVGFITRDEYLEALSGLDITWEEC